MLQRFLCFHRFCYLLNKALCHFFLRLDEDVQYIAFFYDLSVFHDGHSVADFPDDMHFMSDQDNA